MSLLEGGLANVFASAFGTLYLDATLHRWSTTEDGKGGGSSTYVDEPVKAQLDMTTAAMQRAEGFTDTDQRILVLASGVDPISTDDEITVAGQRWGIASAAQDPARAYFDLRGRKASLTAAGS